MRHPDAPIPDARVVKWQTRQLEGLVGIIARGGSSPLPSTNPPPYRHDCLLHYLTRQKLTILHT